MKKLNKIILVDDDETSNYLNQLLIKHMNIIEQIVIAKNGKEALQKLKEFLTLEEIEWPELILLDINMPVMDGFEFLDEFSRFEKKHPATNIFLLTSSDSHRDIERAKNYEIAGYINKPLTEEKLQVIISKTRN